MNENINPSRIYLKIAILFTLVWTAYCGFHAYQYYLVHGTLANSDTQNQVLSFILPLWIIWGIWANIPNQMPQGNEHQPADGNEAIQFIKKTFPRINFKKVKIVLCGLLLVTLIVIDGYLLSQPPKCSHLDISMITFDIFLQFCLIVAIYYNQVIDRIFNILSPKKSGRLVTIFILLMFFATQFFIFSDTANGGYKKGGQLHCFSLMD